MYRCYECDAKISNAEQLFCNGLCEECFELISFMELVRDNVRSYRRGISWELWALIEADIPQQHCNEEPHKSYLLTMETEN